MSLTPTPDGGLIYVKGHVYDGTSNDGFCEECGKPAYDEIHAAVYSYECGDREMHHRCNAETYKSRCDCPCHTLPEAQRSVYTRPR